MIHTLTSTIVYCAVDAAARERTLKDGIRRKSMGWEDYQSTTRHEPIRVFSDQQTLVDQTDGECITLLEILVPPNTPYDSRGFSWYLHANIDPSWIKAAIEYCRTNLNFEFAGA